MTIDEAIKHCLEVAEQNETQAEKIGRQFIGSAMDKRATDYQECAADYRQLAEWLTELKELRRLVDLVAKYAGNSEDVCERYLPSINGDLCVTDGMGASDCTCCGYEYRCDYKTDIGLLEDVETSTNTDVQAVKRGNWVQIGEQSAKCTECGGVLKSNGIDKTGKALIFNAVYHYCPNCGARMDLGDEKT